MIYITGDTHGDITRFNNKKIKRIKKGDYLIICGDFGFIWDGSKAENKILKKLGKKKYNILFVEGCHENYDLLEKYDTVEYCNAKARQISGKLHQLKRGEIYTIDGKKIFAFGGGLSDDIHIRKEHNTYWKNELPTDDELNFAIENLAKNDNAVDFIITHEPPTTVHDYIGMATDSIKTNQLNATFSKISETCKFRMWFFGKCHKSKLISKHFYSLFENVISTEKL